MAHHARLYRHVEQLVSQRPDKAVDILLGCCEDERVRDEVQSCLVEAGYWQSEPRSPSNRVNISFDPPKPMSPLALQRAAGHLPPERQRPFQISSPAPLSPPATESSATSHHSNESARSAEYILLLSITEDGIVEVPVRMRTALIKHSVIRQDLVFKRKLASNLNREVSVSHNGISSIGSLELQWCKPNRDSTHSTTFYVIPGLETDLYLGFEDSGEGPPDDYTTVAPRPQRRQGGIVEGFDRVRPPAPTPPAPSFHRSATMYDSTVSGSPLQRQSHQPQQQQQPPPIFDALLARQQANAVPRQEHRTSQNSPTATVIASNSHTTHSPAMPPASDFESDPNTANDRIRLSLLWDKTPLNIWLEMSAPAEAFFQTFQQQADKRRRMFDRGEVTILLKGEKSAPDGEAYPLSIAEDDLEADWEETLSWVNENRRETSPHIYGRVQDGEG